MQSTGRIRCIIAAVCFGFTPVSFAAADENAGLPLSPPATSGLPTQEKSTLDYLVVSQDATALFEMIARDVGMRLDLSSKVHGVLAGIRLTGSSDGILDDATNKLGLDWFAFNGVIYVSSRPEAMTRIVRLGNLKSGKVLTVLTESGLAVDRLDIKPSADGTSLALSGPPKLLALAEAMIEGIPPAPVERVAESEARIVTIRRGNESEKVRLP